MLTTITKEYVVSHEDFALIVNAAIIKHGFKIEPLNIDFEDFCQEVATHILYYGIDESNKLTTNIYNHVRWTVGDLAKKKRLHFAQMVVEPTKISPKHEVENKDLLEVAMQYAKPREAYVLNQVIGLGRQQVDIAKEFNLSKQRIEQILKSGLKNIRENYCYV